MNKTSAIKFSLILINIFLVMLVILAAALPWLVQWYIEITGRSEKLPAIIMVTCYPCAPFAGMILLFLKKLLKNISNNMMFHSENEKCFTMIYTFSLVISVITIIAGRFYLPFLIVGLAFAFFALLVFVFKTVFAQISAEESGKKE